MTTPKPVTDLASRLTLQRREVAYVLGLGVTKVDELRATGALPSFVEDGVRLFPVSGLTAYVERRTAEDAAEPKTAQVRHLRPAGAA